MRIGSIQPVLISKLLAGSTVLGTAYLLKSFYSQATSEDLTWIIGPTAHLTEIFSSLTFLHETGYGWVDFKHNVVIAPGCAGVNFLIIALCMSSFQILWKKTTSAKEMVTGVFIAALASYLLTVIANTVRITLSVALFKLDIYSEWLTPGMLHRLGGIVVYYLFLCFYSCSSSYFFRSEYSGGQKINSLISRQGILLIPLFWYLSFSLGIPFVNNAFQTDTELFVKHASSVVIVTSLLTLVFFKALCLLGHLKKVLGGGSEVVEKINTDIGKDKSE